MVYTPVDRLKETQLPQKKRRARPIPSSGVFDAPFVYLKLNEQWKAHILGFLDDLTKPELWDGVVSEENEGVQGVLNFVSTYFEATELPVITDIRIENGTLEYDAGSGWVPVGTVLEDCTDVENCLNTSTIITSLLDADTNLQNQITGNDNDIAALQSNDATLQNNIDQNTAQINSNTAQININIADIQQNEVDILNLASLIDANSLDLLAIKSSVPVEDFGDKPTTSEPDNLCGAAWYLAEALQDDIQRLVDDTNNSVSEYDSFLGFVLAAYSAVWDAVETAIAFVRGVANATTLGQNTLGAIPDIAEIIYCQELDKVSTVSAINNSTLLADTKTAYINAINNLGDSAWNYLIAQGQRDTTRDCTGFCGSTTWCNITDFETTLGDYSTVQSTWVSTSGIVGDYQPANDFTQAVAEVVFAQDTRVDTVDYVIEKQSGGGTGTEVSQLRVYDSSDTIIHSESFYPGNGTISDTLSIPGGIVGRKIWFLTRAKGVDAGDCSVIIKSLQMQGQNPNPFTGGTTC